MSLKLITPPTGLVVDLASAKVHLSVDSGDDDTLITAMIGAASDYAEQMTGRALLPQTWELSLDAFPLNSWQRIGAYWPEYIAAMRLTRVPVASITSVSYTDTEGAAQTLSNTLYTLDAADDFGAAYVVPAYNTIWPLTQESINAVRVRYVAGYANAAAVPQAIKNWILLQIAAMYANRESEVVIRGVCVQLGFVDRLLDKYKVFA